MGFGESFTEGFTRGRDMQMRQALALADQLNRKNQLRRQEEEDLFLREQFAFEKDQAAETRRINAEQREQTRRWREEDRTDAFDKSRRSALDDIFTTFEKASETSDPPTALARARFKYEAYRKQSPRLFDMSFDDLANSLILPAAQRKREAEQQTPGVGAGGVPPWMMAPQAGGPMQGAPAEQFWMAPQGAPAPLPWEDPSAMFGLPMMGATSAQPPIGGAGPMMVPPQSPRRVPTLQPPAATNQFGPIQSEVPADEHPLKTLATAIGLGSDVPMKTRNLQSQIESRAMNSNASLIRAFAQESRAETYKTKEQNDVTYQTAMTHIREKANTIREGANEISRQRLALDRQKLNFDKQRQIQVKTKNQAFSLWRPVQVAAHKLSQALRDAEGDLAEATRIVGPLEQPLPEPSPWLGDNGAASKRYWQAMGRAASARERIGQIKSSPEYAHLYGFEQADGTKVEGLYDRVSSLVFDEIGLTDSHGKQLNKPSAPHGAPGAAVAAPKRRDTRPAGAGRAGTLPGLPGLGPQGGALQGKPAPAATRRKPSYEDARRAILGR